MALDPSVISVAMPVMNAGNTILPAIRSLIQQSYRDWECIVIDDGSSDNTIDILKRISDSRIRIYKDGDHKGLACRLNEAIGLSRGFYLARMDGDDIAYPYRLERQLRYLKDHPEVDLVGSYALVFGEGGQIHGRRGEKIKELWPYRLMLKTVPLIHPTFLGKTEWFRSHPYQAWSRHFQDQQLLVGNIDTVCLEVIPDILLGYREERLSIIKQIRYRWSYILAFPFLRRQSGISIALFAAFVQLIKLSIDILAISTGLDYSLLRSRAAAVAPGERLLWDQVWNSVNSLDNNDRP